MSVGGWGQSGRPANVPERGRGVVLDQGRDRGGEEEWQLDCRIDEFWQFITWGGAQDEGLEEIHGNPQISTLSNRLELTLGGYNIIWGDGPKMDLECNFEIPLRQPDELANKQQDRVVSVRETDWRVSSICDVKSFCLEG